VFPDFRVPMFQLGVMAKPAFTRLWEIRRVSIRIGRMQKPKQLFRYFGPEGSDIFAEGKLWLSAAKDFNDIFEVVPRYDRLVQEQVSHCVRMQYAFLEPEVQVDWGTYRRAMAPTAEQIKTECIETLPSAAHVKFSDLFGIVCLCENGESVLMWGHYTKCHRGFVVEFDPSHGLLASGDVAKMEYSVSRPFAEEKDYRKILLTKSTEWAYEQEHRLIIPLNRALVAKRRDGLEKHYVQLPLDAVKAVYFGCRMEPKARDEILASLGAGAAKHIVPYVMRLHPNDYRLVALPWKAWKAPSGEAVADFRGLWKALGL